MHMRTQAVILALLAAALPSQAAIVLSGNFTTGTPTPTLTITEDIEFTMVSSGTSGLLVFDEWTTSDGSSTYLSNEPDLQTFFYSINGDPDTVGYISGLVDNNVTASGDLTANDGGFYMEFTANAGDKVTIRAGSFTFVGGGAGFNADLNGKTFSGNAFFLGVGGDSNTRITNIVPVPEPSLTMLCAIGLSAFLRRKR